MYMTLLGVVVWATLSSTVTTVAAADQLREGLGMFCNLIGAEWEGRFEDAEEPMTLYMTWEPLIGGAAVQMSGWAAGSDMTRRNVYYWDPEHKHVAFLALTSNGYVATGTVQFADSLITFTGYQSGPDGAVKDTRGEWEFLSNGNVRATGYRMQDGKWAPGHRILYTRRTSK